MHGVLLAERFRIGERLGVGGMGEVWAAQDERMRRDVAVKLVHATFDSREAETRARFRREVQMAGRLSHQNIVTVHDWGEVEVGGRPVFYLVMELVRGVPLAKRLKESTQPWPRAVGWGAQIARALDAAHRRDVVHRDIKPANVLLTPDGTAKVLDFGVAKFMGETMSVHELTVTGMLLGSPPYMSPEQAEGTREIDHRSDLYSLGCLIYHAVTGRPPFVSGNPLAVLRMQMEDPPAAPSSLVESLPEPLDELILSLLAKNPEDRPTDAAGVHDALCGLLVEQSMLDGGGVLETAWLGYGGPVAGRILDRAREVRRASEARLAEAKRIRAEALLPWENGTAAVPELDTGIRVIRGERTAQLASRYGARFADEVIEALMGLPPETEGATWPKRHIGRITSLDFASADTDGHHPGQVDDYLGKLVAERDRRVARTIELERHVAQQIAALRVEGGLERTSDLHAVDVITGAYGEAADVLTERNERRYRAPDINTYGFDVVAGGYDHEQVNTRIGMLRVQLDEWLARSIILEAVLRILAVEAPYS